MSVEGVERVLMIMFRISYLSKILDASWCSEKVSSKEIVTNTFDEAMEAIVKNKMNVNIKSVLRVS